MHPERLARRVALSSIFISAALASIKIGVGLAANSVALVSDGFESASDCFTSGMVLLGLWIAGKPPDKEHPYGHGRFEILVGLAIGVVLVASGTAISLSAWQTRHEIDTPAAYALWPLAVSIAVKSGLFAAKLRMSRLSGSSGLKADAWHDADPHRRFSPALRALAQAYAGSSYAVMAQAAQSLLSVLSREPLTYSPAVAATASRLRGLFSPVPQLATG